MFAQPGRRCLSVSFIISSFMVLTATAEAQNPRAGTVTWPGGTVQVEVVFAKPMPSDRYSVAVMPYVPQMGGYSTTTVCTYFGLIKKAPERFIVQHKRCDSGAAVKTDEPFKLDWIVAEHTQ